ncbi:MAG: PHP domain-containing protein, partial [Actinobacteria bacterium]|nr:PHP domain-containing protein [Actinomycetota bacterium]
MGIAAAAAIERHPHLATPCRDGYVRVDMHSHTMFSGDSTTTLDEIVESVVEAGIDVLCVTDHNAIEGAVRLQRELEGDGICRVIVGEEVRTHTGEIIGLFLTERISFGDNAVDTASQIRQQGGVMYVPHPFDPMRRNITEASLIELSDLGLVDAIEAHNSKTSLQSLNKRAREFGESRGLALGAGSDAHVPHALGSAFVEMPDFDGPTEFLAKL